MKPYRILGAALVAAFLTVATTFAADPAGIWTWTVSGRDGQTMETSLKLDHQDGKLTGVISGRMGDRPITDATIKGDEITFSVTRERNGNTFTSKYAGKISGDTIAGTMEIPAWRGPGGAAGGGEGGPRKLEWNAKRVKSTPSTPAK